MFRTTLPLLMALVACGTNTPSDAPPAAGADNAEATKDAEMKKVAERRAADLDGSNAKVPPADLPTTIPAPDDVAAAPDDATKTESGLAYKILTSNGGTEKPSGNATVTIDYTGWTTDGKMFDSSLTRGQKATFPLRNLIKGWQEGVPLMAKGDSARLWIPEELAYMGRPGKPAGMLVFDIELHDFTEPPPPPETPADVAAPPADAQKTASGLSYKVLTPGSGTVHPTAESTVQAHYSGWTTDGNMFDSSIMRGKPLSMPLNRVIPGWTEGVQLMVEGEKTRFWIPEELAYKGAKGAPAGMLVFDIELIKILK